MAKKNLHLSSYFFFINILVNNWFSFTVHRIDYALDLHSINGNENISFHY